MKEILFYFGKKIIFFLSSIFMLSLLVFYIARLAPGDPLVSYYGDRVEKMSVEERTRAEEKLGLHEPIHVQYFKWLKNAFQGEFGISFKYKADVTAVVGGRLKNTLILGGGGFVLTFVLALPLGVFCAMREEKAADKILCRVGTLSSCVPEFWLSLLLIYIFSVRLQILPSSGAYSIGEEGNWPDRIRHLILPLTVVVMGHLWYYAYMIRNRLLEEVRADYVLLAKAKGLSDRQILFCHCIPNILPSVFSIMAISLPHILGGTYIVETVFSYPGIGTLAYESARYKDYHLLMLLCLLTGVVIIWGNLIAQMINERIDPRVRRENLTSGSERYE
ncbi:MAG: ABC transporter permease [Lachnospiraceae bacterium]